MINFKKCLIIILSFSLYSCNDKNSSNQVLHEKEKQFQDSIAKQRDIVKRLKDSVTAIEQEKVIADIQFGIPKKEAEIKIKKFVENSKKKKFSDYDGTYPFIGNYEFSDYGNRGFYFNDKLYALKINGSYITWENYKTRIPQERENIENVIKLKYGESDIRNPVPERFRLAKGDKYLLNSWSVGEKKIELTLLDKGTSYAIDIYIYKPKIAQLVQQQNLNTRQLETDKDREVF